MRFPLQKKKGFSVIEVTIALALLGVGSYYLMSLVRNTLSVQKSATSSEDVRALMANIAMVLGNHDACRNTVGTGKQPTPNPFDVADVRDKDNKVLYRTGEVYGNRALKLLTIKVGGSGMEERVRLERYVPNGASAGTALVMVEWEKYGKDNLAPTDPTTGAKVPLARFFHMIVVRNGAGEIIDCFAVGGSLDQPWKRSPMAANDIYYDEGDVGIGVPNPRQALEIANDRAIQVGSAFLSGGGNFAHFGGNAWFDGAAWHALDPARRSGLVQVMPDGSVSIYQSRTPGALDWAKGAEVFSNGLRPTSTGITVGTPCNTAGSPTPRGTMAYDEANAMPVYCHNSDTWQPVGSNVQGQQPRGSWCGMRTDYYGGFPNNDGGMTFNGTEIRFHDSGEGTGINLGTDCDGHNPRVSCPAGYVRFRMCYQPALLNNCNAFNVCIKL